MEEENKAGRIAAFECCSFFVLGGRKRLKKTLLCWFYLSLFFAAKASVVQRRSSFNAVFFTSPRRNHRGHLLFSLHFFSFRVSFHDHECKAYIDLHAMQMGILKAEAGGSAFFRR
jgi:hypothetical protein